MKAILTNTVVILFTVILFSCDESTKNKPNEIKKSKPSDSEMPSNSYVDHFANSKIKYEYVEDDQTHEYSGNWDFDGDGVNDSIQFVGNGGAHLYFSLNVTLSSDSKTQNFEWLSTDFPLLQPVDSLVNREGDSFLPNFVVSDFNGDGTDDIYMQLDLTIELPEKFKNLKSEDRRFIVSYDKESKDLDVKVWAR